MNRTGSHRRFPPSWLLAGVLLLLLSAGAFAHGALSHSTPGAGDELHSAPRELRLTFTEPVELAVARLGLTGPAGNVALAPLVLGDSATVLVGGITGPLVGGSYTVHWRVTGADGHPVEGEYGFSIASDAIGLGAVAKSAAVDSAIPSAEPAESAELLTMPEETGFGSGSPLYAAVRWLTFGGILGVIGTVAFRLLVLPLVGRHGGLHGGEFVSAAGRGAVRLGLLMTGIAGIAMLLRLYAQSYALNGGEALSADRLMPLIADTTWGTGWLLQLAGVLLALGGLLLARKTHRAGWVMAVIGALALAFSPALSGHAVATPDLAALAVLADGLHVLGAGGWLGSLLVLLVVGIPAAMRREPAERGPSVAALVNAFSPTALFFAGMLLATGVLAAWLHLGTVPMLWNSRYGWTLLIKLGIFSLVFATAAYNFLRVKPRLGDEITVGRLRRLVAIELGVALLVLAVTAVLVATPPP